MAKAYSVSVELGFKVSAAQVHLLFIELLLHHSLIKQMYGQLIHLSDLTHELKLSIQNTKGRADFNGDSSVKSPRWLWFEI